MTVLRLVPSSSEPAIVFSDATGLGSCGAVVLLGSLSEAVSASGHVPCSWRSCLIVRKTQVTAYELMAVLAAVFTFQAQLSGRPVVVFIDDDAALGMVRKGASKKPDLNRFVHDAWFLFRRIHIEVSFYRVPSLSNCADPPSRSVRCPFGFRPGLLEWPALRNV